MVYYIKFLTLIVFLAVTGGVCIGMDKKPNYKNMPDEELLEAYNADLKNPQILSAVMARKKLQEKITAKVKNNVVNNMQRLTLGLRKSQERVKNLLITIQKLEEESKNSTEIFRNKEMELEEMLKLLEKNQKFKDEAIALKNEIICDQREEIEKLKGRFEKELVYMMNLINLADKMKKKKNMDDGKNK